MSLIEQIEGDSQSPEIFFIPVMPVLDKFLWANALLLCSN